MSGYYIQDPRVKVVTNLEELKVAAAPSSGYRAVIWQRPETEKFPLRQAFAEVVSFNTGQPAALRNSYDSPDAMLQSQSCDFRPVADELTAMFDTYRQISGYRPDATTQIHILSNLVAVDGDVHTDPAAVLNCTWSRQGTKWDWDERAYQVHEGDWLFFRTAFEHYTPPECILRQGEQINQDNYRLSTGITLKI